MLIRLFLASVALLLLAAAAVAPTSYERLNAITGTMLTDTAGTCSGTVYGSAIATTKHCIAPGQKEVRFQGRMMKILHVEPDGKEGLLVHVDADLGPSARVGKIPRVGDPVWIVGNPGGMSQMYRQGRVAAIVDGEIYIDCRCWNGDSGAGIFNSRGELIGIYYGRREWGHGDPLPPEFDFPFAYAMSFTAKQLQAARK